MSDTPPPGSSDWWPGSDSDDITTWESQPAFTTQRKAGVVTGGDYVRGSTGKYPGVSGYVTFPGSSNNYLVTPDAPELNITGTHDICIVARIRPNPWTPTTNDTILSKYEAGQLSYLFRLLSAGTLSFAHSVDGSTGISHTSTANLATMPIDWLYVAVAFDVDNGASGRTTRFWTSPDAVTWTQLGSGQTTAGIIPVSVGTSPLKIGMRATGTEPFQGDISYVSLRDGIGAGGTVGGVEVFCFDGTQDLVGVDPATSSFTTKTGHTMSVNRSGVTPLTLTPAIISRPDTQQSALRFATTSNFDTEELTGTGIFYARPRDYSSIEVTWGTILDLDSWGEMAIVRSAFGFPLTVNEGQTLFRAPQSALFPQGYTTKTDADGNQIVEARKVLDPYTMPGVDSLTPLPSGRWYYYSLFFRSGTKWHRYMVTSALLPRNYSHADHLFNNLPPYYQWNDNQMRGGRDDGDLRKFLKIIGYDLDLTREYVQSWLDLYHTDFTPVPLLRRLGDNFGVPYEAGIGDVRYRGLISKVGFLYRSRGSRRGLEEMVTSVTKSSCEVTPSANIMLLPDDSDFFEGTGSWAGIHPDTPLTGFSPAITTVLPPSKVRLDYGVQVTTPPKPDNSGRGMMRMWTSKADATGNVFLTCGDGIAQIWGTNSTLSINNASHAVTSTTMLLNGLSINNANHTVTSSHVALT